MQSIQFFGASGEVTGSCYLLTGSEGTKILIDFGMFQGTDAEVVKNYEKLGFSPSDISAVLLTHAHLDHCGRLPLLIFGGFRGKIYMTPPSVPLVNIILTDSARVAESNLEYEPLYGLDEVEKVFGLIQATEYDQSQEVKEFRITFRDAGHILGSGSVEIEDTGSKKKR